MTTAPPEPVIRTEHLTKHYGGGRLHRPGHGGGSIRALNDVSLEVLPGEIFGFLGPNGAGKTTMIRTLLGFLTATGGTATVLGHDIGTDSVAIRRRIGYLPGGIALYGSLTGLHESTKLAAALETDAALRLLSGGHAISAGTLRRFRNTNRAFFEDAIA